MSARRRGREGLNEEGGREGLNKEGGGVRCVPWYIPRVGVPTTLCVCVCVCVCVQVVVGVG